MANDYEPIRDELIPIAKDIEEHLGNLMSAHVRALDRSSDEKEMSRTLTTLSVQVGSIMSEIKSFTEYQRDADARQRDLESKVTKIMAWGGAVITLVSLAVQYFGNHLLGK